MNENLSSMREQYNIEDSLLASYLPADYVDNYYSETTAVSNRNSEEYFRQLFQNLPRWVNLLLKLRDALVKPFGLSGGDFEGKVAALVKATNDTEIVFGMADKHLDFYASVWCSPLLSGRQTVGVATIVKYNNRLGRVYFALIKPFHRFIIRRMLRRLSRQ